MKYEIIPNKLEYKHPFRLAHTVRDHTLNAYLKIEDGIHHAFGEIVFPPYYPETLDSFKEFMSKIELPKDILSIDLSKYLQEIDNKIEANSFAKAALDIALHNLVSKYKSCTIADLYSLPKSNKNTSFTLGISSNEEMAQKLEEANQFKYIKLKVNESEITRIINYYRVLTDRNFVIDANQGFTDKQEALDWCIELKKMGVAYFEQPFHKDDLKSHEWLTERSPIPIIADESFQRFTDINRIKSSFSGINIKLMKCTGLAEAYRCLKKANEFELKTVIGCMSESSVAINAAWNLAHLADWIDLDGPFLIKNDVDHY